MQQKAKKAKFQPKYESSSYLSEKRVRAEAQKYKYFRKNDKIMIVQGKKFDKSFEKLKVAVCEEFIGRIAGPMRISFVETENSASIIILTTTMDDETEGFLKGFMSNAVNSDKLNYLRDAIRCSNPIIEKHNKKYIKLIRILSDEDIIRFARTAGLLKDSLNIAAPKRSDIHRMILAVDSKYPGRKRSLQTSIEKLRMLLN